MRIVTRFITTPLFAIVAVGSLAASGCSISFDGPLITASDLAGDSVSQDRDLDGFTGVQVRGSAELLVSEGPEFDVTITTDSALQEHITTSVSDGTLVVSQDYTVLGSAPKVTITVTVPDLDAVELLGSSDATLTDVSGGALKITVNGAADVTVDARVDVLAIEINGSGNIVATGSATDLSVDVSGSGNVDASSLASRSADVEVSGSGNISVAASESLDAEISGSGEIVYSGSPRITSDVTGSGEIRAARD